MLLREIKHIFHKELDHQYGRDEVTHFFHHFVEHYLGEPRFHLALHPDWMITREQEGIFLRGLAALRQGQPLHYVLGCKTFMDLNFRLNNHVLIPRPETEELVKYIIGAHKSHLGTLRILDIGTGSGCIAISLAKHLPQAQVFAIDISANALKLASENALENNVDVKFLEADMKTMELHKEYYDIIVSNPPYVLEKEKSQMAAHVKDAEPAIALFVPDERPLLYYEYIAEAAGMALVDGGMLYLEINQKFGNEVKRLLERFNLQEIEVWQDLHGHDRFLKAKKTGIKK